MKIAICGDDYGICEELSKWLRKADNDSRKQMIEVFQEAEKLLTSIQNGAVYDLLYLDVELPDINGVEVGARLKDMEIPGNIIFVSGKDTYCKDMFDLRPFNFYQKPLNREKVKDYHLIKEKEEEKETAAADKKVGVFLPSAADDSRWALDGESFQTALEGDGYDAEIFFADEDSDTQVSQIQSILDDEKTSALVIAPVDAYGLNDVLEQVYEKSIPVISYDQLIMDTDKINYYVTFDTRKAGKMVGDSIIKKMDLEKAREEKSTLTIEFLMGSPDDRDALFFYNGVMEKLQEYFDDGTLVCTSGKQTLDDTAVMRSGRNTAKNDMAEILSQNYTEGTPDIICTGADDLALGAVDALEDAGHVSGEEGWPMITGCGCEAEAVTAVIEGKLADSLFFDNRVLANDCVTMVDTFLKGEKPEISDYEQYDNGTKIVGTVTSDIQLIDADNYQMLVDDGYYDEDEIVPEATPTLIPTETLWEVPVDIAIQQQVQN